MTRIPALTTSAAPLQNRPLSDASALNELQIGDFLNLMIVELQNQDPLNPLENHELLQQISQIREVGATDKLTQTLDAVLLGQSVSSATSLIGQEVSATTKRGQTVVGLVDRVSIANGSPELHLVTDSRVVPSPHDGGLEPGTYRYKVTFEREDGRLAAVDVGPITTTGRNGLDAALNLINLPVTPGSKTVYRTDATGSGDYHLVGVIAAGEVRDFIDTLASAHLPNTTLTQSTVREFGGSEVIVSLKEIRQVRRPRLNE